MIDTSIQLNNHNSYHATELFWADTFSVQTMSHITASFALYSDVVQAAANRIKIRFYTASGAIVSETLHAFAVNTIWERVSVTVAVPATAEKAQICFLAGSYWWAEAKTEEGQTATPYAINAAGQLTWISPNGIYTGTVTASQIIVSPLSGATENDLESRLVTINSNAINLKATTDNNVSRLTTIEAGQASFVKFDDLGTPNGTYINGGNVKTGKIESVDGTSYFDLTNGQIKSNNVELTGKITATSGSIGAWNISSNKLISTNGRLSLDPVSEQIVLGDVTLKDVSVGGSYGKVQMSSTQTSDDIVFMVTNNTSSPTGFDARIWVETPIKNQYAYLDSRAGLSIRDGDNWWGIYRFGLSGSFVLKVDRIWIGGNTYTLTRDANGFLKAI